MRYLLVALAVFCLGCRQSSETASKTGPEGEDDVIKVTVAPGTDLHIPRSAITEHQWTPDDMLLTEDDMLMTEAGKPRTGGKEGFLSRYSMTWQSFLMLNGDTIPRVGQIVSVIREPFLAELCESKVEIRLAGQCVGAGKVLRRPKVINSPSTVVRNYFFRQPFVSTADVLRLPLLTEHCVIVSSSPDPALVDFTESDSQVVVVDNDAFLMLVATMYPGNSYINVTLDDTQR